MHYYHFTRVSTNTKIGPIPVVTTSRSTCPTSCPLKGNGCYADYGPLSLHWSKVSSGQRGGTLDALRASIKGLPKGQLWRMAQAGDLPGDGRVLDAKALARLALSNTGRRGFGYTHYDPLVPGNAATIKLANQLGLTINLSANDVRHADRLASLTIAPVTLVVPQDVRKAFKTPAGRVVAICPASTHEGISCASCGVCAKADRKAIIGFPAHGSGARKAQAVTFYRTMTRDFDAPARVAPRSAAFA